jgi:uncharacterized membrane protein (DUF4010 family)
MSELTTALLASPAWRLLVALSIGLLIGVERERHKGVGAKRAPEGLRTFSLIALLGGLTAQAGSVELITLGGLFTALAALVGYWLGDRDDPGLTTEAALVVTFVLGVLAQTQPVLALGCGVGVATLLAARTLLHHFVRDVLTKQELLDGIVFAVAALVVLPLLPNRSIDPWGVVNPFVFWRLVVVLIGLSAAGYWAMRLLGPRYGLAAAGFASGFVSSSMGIAAMSARAHSNASLSRVAAAGAVASMLGSLIYLFALVVSADVIILRHMLLPFGCAIAPTLGYATFLAWRARASGGSVPPSGRAFDLKTVVVFGMFVVAFALISTFVVSRFGPRGMFFSAATTGLVDAHATAASIATMVAARKIEAAPGALAILIGLSANMAIKIPAAFALGPRPFAFRVTLGLIMLLIGLWVGYTLDTVFL